MIAPFGRALAPARRSLVRRLVGLAAIWSLAVLAAGGLALTIFFAQSSTARFDDDLSVTVDGLLAGTSDEGGHIAAPISDDPRTSRTYSGEYWEIATPNGAGLRAEARSRSLWDQSLSRQTVTPGNWRRCRARRSSTTPVAHPASD